jgi:hypothetical protein
MRRRRTARQSLEWAGQRVVEGTKSCRWRRFERRTGEEERAGDDRLPIARETPKRAPRPSRLPNGVLGRQIALQQKSGTRVRERVTMRARKRRQRSHEEDGGWGTGVYGMAKVRMQCVAVQGRRRWRRFSQNPRQGLPAAPQRPASQRQDPRSKAASILSSASA